MGVFLSRPGCYFLGIFSDWRTIRRSRIRRLRGFVDFETVMYVYWYTPPLSGDLTRAARCTYTSWPPLGWLDVLRDVRLPVNSLSRVTWRAARCTCISYDNLRCSKKTYKETNQKLCTILIYPNFLPLKSSFLRRIGAIGESGLTRQFRQRPFWHSKFEWFYDVIRIILWITRIRSKMCMIRILDIHMRKNMVWSNRGSEFE